MDGLLLIDKPSGLTSHDVVARIRRASGERRVGHTGTLDPLATGLLPIVMGRATRLSSRLTAHRKSYDADIHLGLSTDTDDADGKAIGEPVRVTCGEAEIHAALRAFVGAIAQVPPRHSAKKIDGERAYARARRDEDVRLPPVAVTMFALEIVSPLPDIDSEKAIVRVRVTVSSGFYVRSLARDLGVALGCGAHLAALRRTEVGGMAVERALSLSEAETLGRRVVERLVPMADILSQVPAVRLNAVGLTRALHGNTVGPEHLLAESWPGADGDDIRLIGPDGALVAVAQVRGGALHPVLVVG
jgi:tRNA pseudouridine55 synthase